MTTLTDASTRLEAPLGPTVAQQLDDLNATIASCQSSLAQARTHDPESVLMRLVALGNAINRRYHITWQAGDLDKRIELLREVISVLGDLLQSEKVGRVKLEVTRGEVLVSVATSCGSCIAYMQASPNDVLARRFENLTDSLWDVTR